LGANIGRPEWRMRAGAKAEAAARSLCAALQGRDKRRGVGHSLHAGHSGGVILFEFAIAFAGLLQLAYNTGRQRPVG
jgi:hypothetical protein